MWISFNPIPNIPTKVDDVLDSNCCQIVAFYGRLHVQLMQERARAHPELLGENSTRGSLEVHSDR